MKKTDLAAIVSKGTFGAIPFVGPMIAEIIGELIPNQRIDRIESLLKILELKLDEFDKNTIEKKMKSPESIDLLEDSFIQVSRALSKERKDYIASLIINSLTDDKLKHIEYKKLLSLLNELNDIEIIILKLKSFIKGSQEYIDFVKKHEKILPESVTFTTSQENSTIYKSYITHLENLGLIQKRFLTPKLNELPKFDKNTGALKSDGYKITSLGNILLESINQGRNS